MQTDFWSGAIALDLFFGGIGVGCFLYAVFLNFFQKDKFKTASKIAAIISPISVIIGFLFLFFHLGYPFRFYLIYTTIQYTSVLWWGAWLQAIFVIISLYYAWLWLKGNNDKLIRLIGYLGVPFALAVGIYHGFLLMVFKSRPLWNTGPTTITAICGFVLTGIAVTILAHSLMSREKVELKELSISRNVLGSAIVIQLITLALWMSSLYYGSEESYAAMMRLVIDYQFLFFGGAILVGLVLPLFIGLITTFYEKRKGQFSYVVPLLTSLLVLMGNLALRYSVIMAA